MDSQNYALAARHYTWLILRGAVPRERLRQAWITVGRRYHQAERFYQSAIVFSAVARWFPRPRRQALAAARAAVRAMAQRHGATKASFDEAYLRRLRRHVEVLAPSVYPAVTLAEARAAREAGRFGEALDLLGIIALMRKGYADALYEIAPTHKARLAQEGAQSRRHTATMDAAFEDLFEHCRNAAKTAEEDKARERLAEIAAAGIHALGDAYLRAQLSDPQKAIAHTSGLQARHPGIEGTPSYPLIAIVRLRAVLALVSQTKQAERVAPLLAIVEETWRAANEQSNPHLGRAARTAGRVYFAAAAKFGAAGLARRAREARDRGAELYAESLRAEPKQPLGTYRFVLRVLRERGRSADQRIIVELAPRVIQLHGEPPEAFEDILFVKATLGIAHHGLGHYAKAIPFLHEVESHYERAYQKALGRYRLDRNEYRRDPGKFPRPPQPPRRNTCQPEVQEKLARCYLATHRREQYGWLLKAYGVLDRIHARQPHKRWPVRYNLVETYRRLGNYERVVGLMDRWHFQTGGTMGGSASKGRFRRLMGHVVRDVKKLDDASRRATLLRQVAELRGLLGRQ